MSSSDSSNSSFFVSTFFPSAGAAMVEGQDLLLGQHQLLDRFSRPYIIEEAPDVDIGQGLCKQARPK
jgi:hypothetical protein